MVNKLKSIRSCFLISIAFATLFFGSVHAQNNSTPAKLTCIAFYNIENLFDSIDSPDTDDKEFLPMGANKWNTHKYLSKLKNMAQVISQIGDEFISGGPTILGLAEIENREVVKDLIETPPLRDKGYAIVHFDSPDPRGVDVGLIYKYKAFKVFNAVPVTLKFASNPGFRTRDQLVVSGILYGDTLHIIVNHWPSRRSGPEYREAAARLTRKIVDSLQSTYKHPKIIIMGDLNDDPVDSSVTKHLGAKGNKKEVGANELFNPTYELFKKGVGSLAYRDTWNLFDQIIVSEPLLTSKGYSLYATRIFNKPFLLQQEGQYAGYPFRTFAGGAWINGYSDHLPSFIILGYKDN